MQSKCTTALWEKRTKTTDTDTAGRTSTGHKKETAN
jgi:hypothetical protein